VHLCIGEKFAHQAVDWVLSYRDLHAVVALHHGGVVNVGLKPVDQLSSYSAVTVGWVPEITYNVLSWDGHPEVLMYMKF